MLADIALYLWWRVEVGKKSLHQHENEWSDGSQGRHELLRIAEISILEAGPVQMPGIPIIAVHIFILS